MADLPKIPGYRILGELGSGGMATVYHGFQEKLQREVAIKVLAPHFYSNPQFRRCFIQEARTAASLHHTHIVAIHDVGLAGNICFIVMEYLADSLADRILIRLQGPMTDKEILTILRQTALALAFAHRQGIIHGDIKPGNIMFRTDGSAVLVDFGLARSSNSAGEGKKSALDMGTPRYMSPEQGKGEPLTPASDLYSLGIVLYEMLTGSVPYEGDRSTDIIRQHIEAALPQLPGARSRFQPLLEKMLSKDPRQRLATAEGLIAFIENWPREGKSAAMSKSLPPDQPLPRGIWWAVGTLTIFLAAAAIAYLQRHPAPEASRQPIPSSAVSAGFNHSETKQSNSPTLVTEKEKASSSAAILPYTPSSNEKVDQVKRTASPPALAENQPAVKAARISFLRSRATALAQAEVRALIRKLGFFDLYENPTAKASDNYERILRHGVAVIVDRQHGRMWHPNGSAEAMDSAASALWLERLNAEAYAGFADWRMPTLEEALSLLVPVKSNRGFYLSPLLAPWQPSFWTSDRVSNETERLWIILAGDGCAGWAPADSRNAVLPVRNSTK